MTTTTTTHQGRVPRLFVDADLAEGAEVALSQPQAHYLGRVVRLRAGDPVLVFNGRDGEWRAVLGAAHARRTGLIVDARLRAQPPQPDLHLLFVPLKQARLDYLIQKAVEMGAGRVRPVLSDHGQVRKLNLRRARANAVEAAEQCAILTIPAIDEMRPLDDVLADWTATENGRRLVFADEASERADPLAVLASLGASPLALLVGPEGGFSPAEREQLRAHDAVVPVPLGPRILRADTATVAALALIQAAAGDWRGQPPHAAGNDTL